MSQNKLENILPQILIKFLLKFLLGQWISEICEIESSNGAE
jgi:hypothetical protein